MSDATWNPAGEARIRTDSSKDLEKDERERALAASALLYEPPLRPDIECGFREGWDAAKAHFEARLQQAEAELAGAQMALDAAVGEAKHLEGIEAERGFL